MGKRIHPKCEKNRMNSNSMVLPAKQERIQLVVNVCARQAPESVMLTPGLASAAFLYPL
jgi:hypothetical protein